MTDYSLFDVLLAIMLPATIMGCFYSLTVVAVLGLQRSEYSVDENAGFVTVSVVLIQPSDASLLDNFTMFRYRLQTVNGTAQGIAIKIMFYNISWFHTIFHVTLHIITIKSQVS